MIFVVDYIIKDVENNPWKCLWGQKERRWLVWLANSKRKKNQSFIVKRYLKPLDWISF